MKLFDGVIVIFAVLLQHVLCENPTVNINNGIVMGITTTTIENNKSYHAFRGIPFAKPPTGNLRFKAPQKPDSWNDTLDGTNDGDSCLQLYESIVYGSENCLFINVYTPDLNMNGSLAVMVWIYGGGFTTGSSSYQFFKPDYFLDEGVVYVAFNYRIGALGWLSTEDENSPGNYGLKDQILALEWVQENIAQFGGDPNNVTIFGESAGAALVSYLVQSNLTEGLFKAAIMESGTSLNLWAYQNEAASHAFELGVNMGIVTSDSGTLMASLMEADAAAILMAQQAVYNRIFLSNALGGIPWSPVSEPWSNESAFSGHSHEHLTHGRFRHVPMIVGYNSNEMEAMYEYLIALGLVVTNYDLYPSLLAPYDLTANPIEKLLAAYVIKLKYFGLLPVASQLDKLTSFSSNDQFNRPIREFVRLTSQHCDVYYYRFAYIGDLGGDVNTRSYWGVAHGEELNYLFVSDNNSTAQDIVVRKRMVRMWTNFAKFSTPYYSTSDPLFSSNVTSKWLPARVNSANPAGITSLDTSRLYYLNITSSLLMSFNPNQTDWVFYRDLIYGIYGDGDYTTY